MGTATIFITTANLKNSRCPPWEDTGIMRYPVLLAARKNKAILEIPGFIACGQSGEEVCFLKMEELIPLPASSKLFFLPNRHPVAFNTKNNSFEELRDLYPVAAFLPPGYTGLYSASYVEEGRAKTLPLFSYTPVACIGAVYYVPAIRVDSRRIHDMEGVKRKKLQNKILNFKNTRNRLIRHLADCALNNCCPNAVNFFLHKYECPLPVSPDCNARCIGCISYQPEGSPPASQSRLEFIPTPGEIAEIALIHIRGLRNPVVSFGQGCEGEPLLQAEIIGKAIRIIRKKTKRGTIHMNTNASLPEQMRFLCREGLDSIRVSLNSTRGEFYQRYYSPRGYNFSDVISSIIIAKEKGKFVSLNYLVMPGFTDREDEFGALRKLIKKSRLDMIQWRNLNYDPRRYFKRLNICSESPLLGIKMLIKNLRQEFPSLRHGYFNLPKEYFNTPK